VFGEVINGKSIVREIENLPTESGDKPLQEAIIIGIFPSLNQSQNPPSQYN